MARPSQGVAASGASTQNNSASRTRLVFPFSLPADREEACRLAALFWQRVHIEGRKSATQCWVYDPDLRGRWQYSRNLEKRCASPQRGGLRHCARPKHLRIVRRAELLASVAELRARGLSTAAIARRWGVIWSVIGARCVRSTGGTVGRCEMVCGTAWGRRPPLGVELRHRLRLSRR
jgi:hypothetical protein